MPPETAVAQGRWAFEHKARTAGFARIAGIDEAGRGPLAGPVVSAAVVLPDALPIKGIDDSKKLGHRKREMLYSHIYDSAVAVGIGIVDPVEIDRINILEAALCSMAMAAANLYPPPDYLLIDGNRPAPCPIPQEPIPHGDCLCISIAAASIVAKVTRDRLMDLYHEEYPEYGFADHKGYPTKSHREAIARFGCCPIHRRTFKGVKEFL